MEKIKTIKQYVVDAFTDRVFSGNPAAVCVMDEWISDNLMMNITKENNLSETAFVIMNYYEPEAENVSFQTLSGILTVKKDGALYEMDFPVYNLKKVDVTDEMEEAIGKRPLEAYIGRDLLCVFDDDKTIRQLSPGFGKNKIFGRAFTSCYGSRQ